MSRPSIAIAVTDAVRLRQWALQCLTGEVCPPPDVCPGGHRIFFEAERCAIALQRRFDEEGLELSFSRHVRQQFADRRAAETGRIQSARRQLRTIGEIARKEGCRVAVLKGAVPVFSDARAVDLVDIDLLATPTDGNAFAAALDRSGYWPVGESTPRHLDRRSKGEAVAVEIHTTLDRLGGPLSQGYWNCLIPHDAIDDLFRLGGADHLWNLLEHATREHPERRGNIRDIVLIANAASDCSVGELQDVHNRIAAHSAHSPMNRTLSAAEAMNAHEVVADTMEYESALRYAVRLLLVTLPIPRLLEGYVYQWTFALLLGRLERRDMWRQVFAVSIDPSCHQRVAWLERHAPGLGRGVRVAARIVRAGLALCGAVPAAMLSRRLAHRAVARLHHSQTPATKLG